MTVTISYIVYKKRGRAGGEGEEKPQEEEEERLKTACAKGLEGLKFFNKMCDLG